MTTTNVLTGSSLFERKVVRFQVLSPVHIGTHQGTLSTLEFISHKGSLYVVDDEKLGDLLVQRNLVDKFVAEVRGNHFVNLSRFITDNRLGDPASVAARISRYRVTCPNATMIHKFRPMIRDGLGRVFIPGTAIKGVFRTGLLASLLQNRREDCQWFAREYQNKLDAMQGKAPWKIQREKTFFSRGMQTDLLSNFNLANAQSSQNRDLLRCLKVADAYPVNKSVETRAIKIKFLSKNSEEGFSWSKQKRRDISTNRDLELWLEAVVSGSFETEITWDRLLFDRFVQENKVLADASFPSKSLDELLKAAIDHSSAVVSHEIGFFQPAGNHEAADSLARWYNDGKSTALFRVGFGSGMLSTTVNLLWSDELRKKIRNTCGHNRGKDPAPKSRRVWQDEHGVWRPMGWTKIMLVDDERSAALDTLITGGCDLDSSEKEISGTPTQKTVQAADETRLRTKTTEPESDTWENAHLSWSPGNQQLTVTCGANQAFGEGKDLVPEALLRQLFGKKKRAKAAKVVVQKVGNAWRILEITPQK